MHPQKWSKVDRWIVAFCLGVLNDGMKFLDGCVVCGAALQLAVACMSLSAGVSERLVMVLCLNCTVLLRRLEHVLLM